MPLLARWIEVLFFVAGRYALDIGRYPDLQEMHGFGIGMIELAVPHAAARAHALDTAVPDDGTRAHAVLVFQRAVEHIGNDLHVAVAVHAEAAAPGCTRSSLMTSSAPKPMCLGS